MGKNKIKETSLILKPSPGKGIGVFSIEEIPEGKRLYWQKTRVIPKRKLRRNKILRFLCNTYGVEIEKGYECPRNFQRMEIMWFLNHSNNPNLSTGKSFYFVNKKIKKGEELTIDYREFKEPNQSYLKEYK